MDGAPLFARCVQLVKTGEKVPGSDRIGRWWPHDLPGVSKSDAETAYLIRTDRGVEQQYREWLRTDDGRRAREIIR
jgi:hypothetical protein